MTGAFVSRRRADKFDAMVSAPALARDTASQDAELLELVGSLRSMPEVAARPDFVSELRSQLVVEAARLARPVVDEDLRVRLTPRQRAGARERRAATVLGGFAIVAATGSMAMASQSALPGDVLYPVKRAIENAQTNLQSDDAAKAQTLIAHAERRLQEAEQLTAEGADASAVAETLQDFTDQSNQATELALDDYATTGDERALGDLRSFAGDSMTDLDKLGDAIPADARPALITAAQSVLQADSAAFQVCPTCGDGAVTDLPEFATEPAANITGLLDYSAQDQSIVLPNDLIDLDKVENIAANEPPTKVTDEQEPAGEEPTGDELPVTDPSDTTDVDTDPVTNPIQQLGDRIKDDLTKGDKSDTLDSTVEVVTGVVGGVGGLVDGLLGN